MFLLQMESMKVEEKYALPEGDYVIVTWDLVATGGSLYDDICQIAAYTPGFEAFSQHVMPYHNMSVGSRRRHNINVISAGRYRILKDLRTNKTLRTKSDFSALNDFMEWLSNVKGSSDGIILVAHDSRKLIASVLMEVVNKYRMREQFCSVVKGFANCFTIAENKCTKPVRSYSIRALSNVLLSNEENLSEATQRAQATYNVLEQLFEPENTDTEETEEKKSPRQLALDIQEFSCTVDGVNKMSADLKALHDREESLHPLFDSMRANRAERQRSFNLQRLLARSNIDYEILSDIYKKGGLEAIHEVLKCTLAQEHARELSELKHVFALHFDPEYKGEWKPEKAAGDRPRTFRRNSRSKKTRKTPSSPESDATKTLSDGKSGPGSPSSSGEGKEITPASSPKTDTAVPALTITTDEDQTQTVVEAV